MTYPSELHKIVAEATNLAPSTQNKYLRDLNQWIEFAGADPKGWTRQRAQDFYVHLTKTQKLKPQSANRLIASLAFASKWRAKFANQSDLDFVAVMQAKPSGKLAKHALDESQVRALLDGCKLTEIIGTRDFGLILLALETGMRVMSLTAARIDNITEKSKAFPYPTIKIPEKGSGGELRDVPLSDTAIMALGPWRSILGEKRRKGPLFRPVRPGHYSPQDPAWGRIEDKALAVSTIKKLLHERSIAAGIDHVNPHMFRHTFVTWRTEAGIAPHEIAAITGHALNLGALGGYMDEAKIGAKVRETTPEWLAAYVRRRVGAL